MEIKSEYGNMERRERALLLTGVAGKMREIPDGTTAILKGVAGAVYKRPGFG